jgi:hypothetical protein
VWLSPDGARRRRDTLSARLIRRAMPGPSGPAQPRGIAREAVPVHYGSCASSSRCSPRLWRASARPPTLDGSREALITATPRGSNTPSSEAGLMGEPGSAPPATSAGRPAPSGPDRGRAAPRGPRRFQGVRGRPTLRVSTSLASFFPFVRLRANSRPSGGRARRSFRHPRMPAPARCLPPL